jgi:YVTN family beta-propeller protein
VGAAPDGLIYADGSLWTANFGDGTVTRVDPVRHRVVATIPAGAGAISLTVAGGSVWVADYTAGTVRRIDPGRNKVTAAIETGGKPVGFALAGRTLWVFNQADSTATLISARSGRKLKTVPVGVAAGFVTVAHGLIWVPDFQGGTGTVIAINPATRKTVKRVKVGAAPITVSFADGSGWVSNTGAATVTRFSARTGRVQATIPVSGGSIGPLLATAHGVWVSVYAGGELARIDPATNTVTATVHVGLQPQNLALAGPNLWVAEGGANDVALVTPAGTPSGP